MIQTLGAVSIVLNPTTVAPGQSSVGTVTLSAPAPAGGAVIALAGEHPCCLLVPANITIAENQTSAQFSVGTTNIGQPYAGWVSASYSGSTQQAILSVQQTAGATVASLVLSPSTVTPGQSTTATVSLSGPAPAGGASVSLGVQHTCCILLTAFTVVVPQNQTSAQFSVTGKDIGQSYAGFVSASYGGASQQAILNVSNVTATPLSACTEIRSAGNYILTSDITDNLPGQNVACISIKSTSGVTLDCQGHNISDLDTTGGINLSIQASGNVSVSNCTFRLQPGGAKASAVSIVSGSYLTLTNNVIGDTGMANSD